jgi:hypothetical protein
MIMQASVGQCQAVQDGAGQSMITQASVGQCQEMQDGAGQSRTVKDFKV